MSKGRAKIAISQGLSVWVLDAPQGFGDASFHSHHAIQITVALSGQVSLATPDKAVSAPAIAVAADARHKFDASGLLAFLFVEPEGEAGRALTETLLQRRAIAAIDCPDFIRALVPLGRTFDEGLAPDRLLSTGLQAIEFLLPERRYAIRDPRIGKILDYTARHLDKPLSLAAASQGVFLSPERLRHLFVEQTGLPYKTYLLWLRLMRALDEYAEGESLTQAAHAAGFSDSAHFSRVFKRTFGLPATTLTRI